MTTKDRGIRALRFGALAVLAAFVVLPMTRAGAYLYSMQGANIVRWSTASPGFWNNTTKTLSWSLTKINFPQPNWPTAAQAGAAFQNSYQSHQDTIGTAIKFNRLPDTTNAPVGNDGQLQMSFAPNENNDYYGTNISGAFAVTYVQWDTVSGSLIDADIVMNGDPATFSWATTGPPPPGGSNDVEVTSVHEQSHSIGGNHTVYYYAAVWWVGRYPELLMFDRCLGPDDRVLVRTLYPAAPNLGTISGTVTLNPGGGGVNKAVIVATDSNHIPHATVVTDTGGFYAINVPAGTGYSVTAHHNININYNSDINFFGATGFVSSNSVNAITVTAGATTGGQNFTVAGGVPTMELSRLALSSVATLTTGNATQTLFFNKGNTYTTKLEFTGVVTDGNITAVSCDDPNIIVTTGATTASNNAQHVICAVTFNVQAAAVAGVRNIHANRGAERLFLPSYIEVLDTGIMSVATGTQNPAAGSAAFAAVNRPLLQFALTPNAVEDIRIRKLQFNLAGSGPALPAVRLWNDNGTTAGVVDAGDTRIFSGNAYANSPVSETITATPPGTIVFDNLCLSLLAGTTTTLLLTADMPAAGSGGYTVNFDPTVAANVTAHGMFWGDVLLSGGATPNGVITGTTVNGGTQSLGNLAVGTMDQVHTTGLAPIIPVGGSTNETQITLRGVVTASTGTVGLEVEAKPLGTAFTGVGTFSSATSFASGTLVAVNNTGLVSGTGYHWRARALSSASAPSGWTSFGANAETTTDFNCDTSTTGNPTGPLQFDADSVTMLPLAGTTKGFVYLQASTGTNSQTLPVRLEFEVQPTGTAFAGTPNYFTGFAATPTQMRVQLQLATNDYHWQVRSATPFGSTSAFVPFNGSGGAAIIHFHLDAFQEINADAGCIGRASGMPGPWMIWVAAGAALFGLSFRKGAARKAAATLVVLVCLGGAALAAEDGSLPRSLAEAYPGTQPAAKETFWPEAAVASPEPAPAAAAEKSFMTLDAYLGFLIMDMDFEALGTDLINRKVSGMGTLVLGAEGLFDLFQDWRIGLAAEINYWGDIRIIAVGPVASWRFSGSHTNNITRYSDTEHFARVGFFYEKLTVTKSNFGSFDASFGVRLGYELRMALGDGWFVTLGVHFQYSEWQYSPTVLTGDDKIGGFGGLISVGAAWLP